MTYQGSDNVEACDTHMHVFRRGAPTVSATALAPPEADVAAYLAMRNALGLRRAVVVQPTAYGTDNTVAAEGIAALGKDAARGVAVIDAEVSDAGLRALDDAGFCGARLQMLPGGVIPWDQADRVAQRAADAGWHVQLQLDGRTLPEREAQIMAWPVPVVIDHIGKFLEPVAVDHAAFRCLLRLVDRGKVWVKLSAPYEVSALGAPAYADVFVLARAWLGMRRNGCSGRRTGRTWARRHAPANGTCSVCSMTGRPMRRAATGSSAPMQRRSTGSTRARPSPEFCAGSPLAGRMGLRGRKTNVFSSPPNRPRSPGEAVRKT